MTKDEFLFRNPKTTLVPHTNKPESHSIKLLKAMGETKVTLAVVEKLDHSPT